MRDFKKVILMVICLLGIFLTVHAQQLEYGVEMVSYPHPLTERTTLSLDAGELIPTGKDCFGMSFMMSVRDHVIFGDVFRMITDKGESFDLMYTLNEKRCRVPIWVVKGKVFEIPSVASIGSWIPVSVMLDVCSGQVKLDFNGTEVVTTCEDLESMKGIRIYFGRCTYGNFALDDVASVNVKDIKLYESGKEIRHWKLLMHDGDVCYDEISGKPAHCTNPQWILDKSLTWKHVKTMNFPKIPDVAFDHKEMFYLTTDGTELFSYGTATGEMDTLHIQGTYPSNGPNQMTWDVIRQTLMTYNLNSSSSAFLDFKNGVWTGGNVSKTEHDYWNAAFALDSVHNRYYSFGGYGHYRYNNTLVSFAADGDDWQEITLDNIPPRISSGCCVVDSVLYILGGRGSLTGKQELSPEYFYDLYAVNLHSKEVKKIWEMDMADNATQLIFGDGMFYEAQSDCFLAVALINHEVVLYRINRQKPEMLPVSFPIAFKTGCQYSYLKLYKNNDGQLFISLTISDAFGHSDVDIYRMDYPFINRAYLIQNVPKAEFDKNYMSSAVILLFICMIIGGMTYLLKRRKPGVVYVEQPLKTERNSMGCICLLGNFIAKDKEGNDITTQFTPILKSLLALLIIHTERNAQGIPGAALNNLLWPYKPDEASANNNRNVSINKLRRLLEKIGDIKINSHSKSWSISMPDDFCCDYKKAMRMAGIASTSKQVNEELLELLLKGMLLPDMDAEWLVPLKKEYSEIVVSLLSGELDDRNMDDNVSLKIAGAILMHDFLNEKALHTKCKILWQQGKPIQAKEAYQKYCMDYKDATSLEYQMDFKSIIAIP